MDRRILKGFQSEMTAEMWLVQQGFIVYSKKAVQSPIDFVCYCPAKGRTKAKILLIDVKSSCHRKNSTRKNPYIYRSPTPLQKKMGVRLLYVSDKGECTLDSPLQK